MSASPSKRRPGEVMGGSFVSDPRPVVQGNKVLGARCGACGYPSAPPAPWCPVCQKREQQPADFGPLGTVWASTLVQIPVGRWTPPYAMAYIDLDEGPRVIAHLQDARIEKPGTRVRIIGGEEGDLLVASETGT